MRDVLLTAAAAALLLGSLGAAQAQMPVTRTDAPLRAQPVASVCGSNGCVKVQTHKITHQKPGSVAKNHI
jgi:hypothetical protein